MRIYLSGPMTGYEGHNFPAFHAAQAFWESLGWDVENPARNAPQPTRAAYMRLDYERLMRVDAIAMLPGWERSEGAMSELNHARELDLEVFDAMTGLPYDGHVWFTACCT